jgi:hypothetical protein
MKPSLKLFIGFCCISLQACIFLGKKPIENDNTKVFGWKPVYTAINPFKIVNTTVAKPTVNAGKIYAFNNYLLQRENGEGIHIIDITNKNNPVKTGFINCKGAAEIEMKDGYLITNNFNDLVTLQINFANNAVTEAKRLPNALTLLQNNYRNYIPPDTGWYLCNYRNNNFEVIDKWVKDSIFRWESCYKPQ